MEVFKNNNLLRIRPFKRSKYSRGHFILLNIEKMTETERFFLPFIDKIERLNGLKNGKSYRNLTEKFSFEYHIIETSNDEPLFQVLFDFNGGRVRDRFFLASDYELFEARIDGIRDIFWAMK